MWDAPTTSWTRVPGHTRQLFEDAAVYVGLILDDDMLEKLEGDIPREPPL